MLLGDNKSDQEVLQVQLMLFMCQLVGGHNETGDQQTSCLSHLEECVDTLDQLAELHPNLEGIQELRYSVMVQAVFQWCRHDKFDSAKETYTRLFEDTDRPGKNISFHIRQVLRSKRKNHSNLDRYSYEDLLVEATEVLQQIHKQFPVPDLIKMAKSNLQEQKKEEKKSTVNSPSARRYRVTKRNTQPDLPTANLRISGLLLEGVLSARDKEHLLGQPHYLKGKDRKKWMEKLASIRAQYADVTVEPQGADKDIPVASETNDGRERRRSPRKSSTQQDRLKRRISGPRASLDRGAGDGNSSYASEDELALDKMQKLISRSKPLRRSLAPTQMQPSKFRKMGGVVTNILKIRRQWEPEEEENLVLAVQRCGVGNWAKIKASKQFPLRTNINLKDKWRQMEMSGRLREIEDLLQTQK